MNLTELTEAEFMCSGNIVKTAGAGVGLDQNMLGELDLLSLPVLRDLYDWKILAASPTDALLVNADGELRGVYIGELLMIGCGAEGKGLSTSLILAATANREPPTNRKVTAFGEAALRKAWRVANGLDTNGWVDGNTALRRALDDASTERDVRVYLETLTKLGPRHGHSITTEPSVLRFSRFNCFAFAFRLTEHERYDRLVDAKQSSALLNAKLVTQLLERGDLIAVDYTSAKPGDIVLYFNGRNLTHAGRVIESEPRCRILSKWGGNEVHSHALWEVPLSYGATVRFVETPPPEDILQILEAS